MRSSIYPIGFLCLNEMAIKYDGIQNIFIAF